MRILWSSNSPFVTSGYGSQTACATRYLKDMGHDVAILAFYGLQGSRINWGDIPVYPNNPQDWGVRHSPMFYKDWKADVLITLVDVWVLGSLNPEMNFVPWMPVDHDPIPPKVVDTLRITRGLVKPIAMSKFGQKQLADNDIDAYYIPHSVNCEVFTPNPDLRNEYRKRFNWEDKFVVGAVGTNHVGDRKNWRVSLKAVSEFEKMHPGEIIYYMHTTPKDEKGEIDIILLRNSLGLEDIVKFPPEVDMTVGIPTDVMSRMYNCLDVFLLPSKGEGFGVPLIESMACGTPCITTDCTAQTEIMEGAGGWLIKDLKPWFTPQGSWQFDCTWQEVVERLEQAYQAKKDGTMINHQKLSRSRGLEYDDKIIYKKYWPPVLADIEKRIKTPKNLEGIQEWRRVFIPKVCLPRKVLDIGCGLTTPYYPWLSHLGEYTGIDNRLDGKAPVEGKRLVKADACALPFKDGEFGFVWMSEVLEHLDEPEKALSEAKRVGQHGVCLFSTPQNSFFKIDPEHKVVKIPYVTLTTGDGCIVW